jgi:NAD(P)H-dependent FMN reductase
MSYPHIALISSSIRTGRRSHWVAQYFEKLITEKKLASISMLDLKVLNFPLFEERLKYLPTPPESVVAFAEKIVAADGVLIVTPEYNAGYPAALKNALDMLYDEWHRKPVAVATVSAGAFGGAQVTIGLQSVLSKMKVLLVPAPFAVPHVEKAFTPDGIPTDPEPTEKRALTFVNELLYVIAMRQNTPNVPA